MPKAFDDEDASSMIIVHPKSAQRFKEVFTSKKLYWMNPEIQHQVILGRVLLVSTKDTYNHYVVHLRHLR